MNWFNFRNKVKEDLYNYKSEEDGLDIWNSIQGQVEDLNVSKKKKDYRFLFVLLFLIGSAGSVLFYVNSLSPNKSVIEKPTDIKQLNGESELLDIKRNEILENETNTELDKTELQKEIAATVREDLRSKVETVDKSSQITTHEVASHLLTKSSKKIAKKFVVEFPIIQSDIVNIESILDTKTNPLDAKNDNNDFSAAQVITSEIGIEEKKIVESISKIKLISLAQIDWATSTFLPIHFNENIEAIDNTVPKVKRFSLGLNAGLFHAIKTIEAKAPEDIDFRNGRVNSERVLETIHAGIYGEYALNSRFSFSIGFDYTRINEEFRFVEVDNDIDFVEGIRFVFNGQGVNHLPDFALRGLVKETTTTTTDYTLYNNYELIDIPLLLTYKNHKNKWSYGVRAGLIANMSYKAKGRILVSEFQSEDLNNQNVFKNSLGLSYSLGLVLEHRINNSFSFVTVPSFRYFPNEVSAENYSLKQEFQFIGGDIGLKYSF